MYHTPGTSLVNKSSVPHLKTSIVALSIIFRAMVYMSCRVFGCTSGQVAGKSGIYLHRAVNQCVYSSSAMLATHFMDTAIDALRVCRFTICN